MTEIIDEAVISLGLDNNLTEPLARAVEEAKAEVAALGRTKAKIQVDADTEKARAELKLLQKELDSAAARQKAYQKLVDESDGAKKGGYTTALKQATAQAEAARAEVKNQRDIVQAYQQKGRVIQLVGRDIQKTLQDEAKAQKEATTATKDAKKAAEDAANADLKRAQGVQKVINLQRTYAESQKKLNDLQKAYTRAQGSDKIRVNLDTARALADMEVLRESLKRLGAEPIDIKTKVDTTGGKATSFLKSITGGEDPRTLRNIGNEVSDLGDKLKGARVNVGPFSTSLYGVLAAGTALAPMLTGLVGALGSLVAVTGAGLAGGIGVGAAAFTGFGLATLGVVAAVKPYVTQITAAVGYQKTLNAAIAKYGPNSKQAAAAQKIFNNEMKTVSPLAKEAVAGFHAIDDQWKKATGSVAQRDLGKILGASFKAARSDMGFFAADTNKTLNAVTTGFTHFAHQISSGAGKAALSNIFGNFTTGLKPAFSGLSSLADAFLRITSTFSNFLPGLSKGFSDWAKNIDNAAKKSGGFSSGVKETVGAMRDLGHFTEAAGRFLLTFFKAGVGPGEGLLNRMTTSLNKLSTAMGTVGGQRKLNDFFARSVTTTVALWNALMPLISAFVQFSQATAPVADIMLNIVSEFTKLLALAVGFKPIQLVAGGALGLLAISKLTGTLREATGLSASLAKNLFTALSTSRDMGPVNAFKSAFGGSGGMVAAGETLQAAAAAQEAAAGSLEAAAASLEGAAGASRLASAAPVVAEAAPVAAEAGGVAAGAEIGAETGALASAAPEAEGAIAGVGGALLDLATGPVGIAIGAVAALAAGVTLLGNSSDSSKNALDQTRKAVKQGQQNIAGGAANPAFSSGASGQNIGGSSVDQLAVNAAARDYYKIVAQGKQNTEAGRNALVTYNDALHQQSTDLSAAKDFQKQVNDGIKKQVDIQSKDQLNAQKGVNDATKAYNDDLKKETGLQGGSQIAKQKAADALKNLKEAQQNLNTVNQQALRLANQDAAAKLNEQRQLTGLVPVSARYAQSVGQLTRELASAGPAGAAALKQLTNIPDPQKVVGLSKAFNALTSATDKTKAIKIIADTSNPTQAIAKLNALELKEKTLKLLQSGSDAVIAAMTKINGKPLPEKVLHLLGNATDALSKHHQVQALQDVQKALRILGDDGSALAAVGAVNGALNSLPSSKTISITSVYTSIFKTIGHGSPRNAAAGGAAGGQPGFFAGVTPALAAVQTRAARLAEGRPTQRTQGGVYGSPTYLVGEENRPEFVISTNPQYRQRNVQYLKQAASLFGGHVEGFATGRGNETTARKKAKKPKKPANEFVFGGLSAADRIGGIGVDDINTKINNIQGNVSSDNSKISTYNSRIRSDQSTIDRVNKIPPKKRTANEKADLITKSKDLSAQNKLLKASEKKLGNDKKSLKATNAILAAANKYITQFGSLENNIASVGSLMNAAEASPSDNSTGVNPKNEKMETHTWAQWRSILSGLEKQHTSLLQSAWSDAKKRAGKNPDALHTSYVTQLAEALGASISDEASVEAATDANATAASQPSPESMADFLTLIRYGSQEGDLALAGLETQQNLDDIGALQNPGNPAYLKAQIDDANALVAFYENVYSQAQNYTNPTYPGGLRPDPSLLQEVTGAMLQATQDAQGIQASAQGPSQAQLTSTALSSLYSNYGSNSAGLLLGAAMGMSPTNMVDALAGGQVAQDALSGSARASAVPGSGGGTASASGASTGHTIIQNNNFSQPPDDPHHWSKGIEWELGALA